MIAQIRQDAAFKSNPAVKSRHGPPWITIPGGEAMGRSRALDALATKRRGIVVASPEYMVQMLGPTGCMASSLNGRFHHQTLHLETGRYLSDWTSMCQLFGFA